MNKMFVVQALACILFATAARSEPTLRKIGDVVQIMDGQIQPTNTVAHIQQLAATSAEVQSAISIAVAAEQAAAIVSNELAEIYALLNARSSTGYIRGGIESFSEGIEPNTNIVASIIKFDKEITATNLLCHLYTYFTEDPGSFPFVRSSESLQRTNTWTLIDSVGVELTTTIVGNTEYECYKNTVALPLSLAAAYFRVGADVVGTGTGTVQFPVDGGISVGGRKGITTTIIYGTNTWSIYGGVWSE